MREHITEQIDWRISFAMDKQCYDAGQCKLCGCATTALQMASKSCDKPCYPEMMNSFNWINFYYNFEGIYIKEISGKVQMWILNRETKQPILKTF